LAHEVRVLEIDLDKLDISPLNVRKDLGDISELAASIREEGVLQPLLARPSGDRFEVVAGSRRLAAAREVGITAVPAVVRSLSDAQAVAASLTENLQRGDLSLEERVDAYKKLRSLDPGNCGSWRGLARAVGRQPAKVVQDFEAYDALQRLRPHGVQVLSCLTPAADVRRRGEALPEYHATLLEQAFSSVRSSGHLEPQEEQTKYVEIAREIAPLDRDDAKKVLDQFKMYPERPVDEIKSRALAKVDREVSLDLGTARRLDELATSTGRRWEDVIATLVEAPPTTPTQPGLPLGGMETQQAIVQEIEAPPRAEPLELPEEQLSEQIIGKTLWNVEQAERGGLRWDYYTIGYSQKSIEQFIRVLQSRGVCTLVDIRHDPVSMYKPDFSKDNLRRALEVEDIAYIHIPELGVPREMRSSLAKTGDWEAFFGWYDANIAPRLSNGLMKQLTETAKPPLAFMCVEQNPQKCHRHRVALTLGQMGLTGADL
jgi:ParB/RepB/Spo0J family partition protein